ncbi:hypothetical protein RFI_07439, partial [Reticulomyxa filosa]
ETLSRLWNELVEGSNEMFESWTNSVMDQFKNLNDKNKKLLELDVSGKGELKVNYSIDFISLIQQVRLLKEFGHKVSKHIEQLYTYGNNFYLYANQLKQIANFYNTMSTQIIDSQKGMLLSEAREFEQLVKTQNDVLWDKPESCTLFINKLIKASEKVSLKTTNFFFFHF